MNYKTQAFTLVLTATLFISCKDNAIKEKPPVRPVSFEQVGFLAGEDSRVFSGTANTGRVINLSFRNTGIIVEFNLKVGQIVKKGDLLAKLDNVQSRLSYENTLSSLNSAKSQMNTAKLSLNRVRSLYEKGSTSLSDFEATKNLYRTSVASFESANRSVAIQKQQVNYGYLYAPEDGIIAKVNAEIDENVSIGKPIAVLNAGTAMEISLGIPENIINQVTKNKPVIITISSIQNTVFEGVVTEVSPSIDLNSSTYPVQIKVIDPTMDIKSGMAANVTFEFGNQSSRENMLVVPAKSVGEDSNGNFVFLIQTQDQITTVKKQAITIGALSSQGFEVTKGLSAGQKIAIAGLQTLLDGQQVKIK